MWLRRSLRLPSNRYIITSRRIRTRQKTCFATRRSPDVSPVLVLPASPRSLIIFVLEPSLLFFVYARPLLHSRCCPVHRTRLLFQRDAISITDVLGIYDGMSRPHAPIVFHCFSWFFTFRVMPFLQINPDKLTFFRLFTSSPQPFLSRTRPPYPPNIYRDWSGWDEVRCRLLSFFPSPWPRRYQSCYMRLSQYRVPKPSSSRPSSWDLYAWDLISAGGGG